MKKKNIYRFVGLAKFSKIACLSCLILTCMGKNLLLGKDCFMPVSGGFSTCATAKTAVCAMTITSKCGGDRNSQYPSQDTTTDRQKITHETWCQETGDEDDQCFEGNVWCYYEQVYDCVQILESRCVKAWLVGGGIEYGVDLGLIAAKVGGIANISHSEEEYVYRVYPRLRTGVGTWQGEANYAYSEEFTF